MIAVHHRGVVQLSFHVLHQVIQICAEVLYVEVHRKMTSLRDERRRRAETHANYRLSLGVGRVIVGVGRQSIAGHFRYFVDKICFRIQMIRHSG